MYIDHLLQKDGTLTDSIAAVEAAWHKVANEIGQDPKHVIAATHGKRAIDNLAQFKPNLKAHEIEEEVERFEETILFFADAYTLHGSGSVDPRSADDLSSGRDTPELSPTESPGSSNTSSEVSSIITSPRVGSPSFPRRLHHMLSVAASLRNFRPSLWDTGLADLVGDEIAEDVVPIVPLEQVRQDALEAWQLEAAKVNRSVRILPGVRTLMDSIPQGRYAVATSGAKTYGKTWSFPLFFGLISLAFGCMKRVGIIPPPVTITADDKRLKAGKPAPDPFLLAAKCLGYDACRCVVFEDSPSGIKAGVASGATVIAVCTSHDRSQIQDCGAHYVVKDLESVRCEVDGGVLKFTIQL